MKYGHKSIVFIIIIDEVATLLSLFYGSPLVAAFLQASSATLIMFLTVEKAAARRDDNRGYYIAALVRVSAALVQLAAMLGPVIGIRAFLAACRLFCTSIAQRQSLTVIIVVNMFMRMFAIVAITVSAFAASADEGAITLLSANIGAEMPAL
jgi:hypothetical protein